MPSLRDNFSLGVFAENADQVQGEGVRNEGEAYRNTSFTTFQQNSGKAFTQLPFSEDFNQQLNNISYFANMQNRQSILGWNNTIEYNRPAIVFGSDNKLYVTKRDGNRNIDPITDNQDNPQWWEKVKESSDLYNIYSNETPGSEGAGLVGCTYQPVNGGDRTGVTLQQNLDYLKPRLEKMGNVRVLACVNRVFIDYDFIFPVNFVNRKNSFNVSSINKTTYSKRQPNKPPSLSPSKDLIGYLTVNFINPLPDENYIVMFDSEPDAFAVSSTNPKKFYLNFTTSSIANKTVNGFDIGLLTIMNGVIDPTFGIEDPYSPEAWEFNFYCLGVD